MKSNEEVIFHHSRASNSKLNIPIWFCRDFMPVLVTSKFDEDPNWRHYRLDMVKYGLFGTQVTPRSIVRSGWISN